ncbi:chromodomain helicase hrp1 [Coccidioides immitis H538.4]|uniref:Chromodomain helicase hrp1 n=1 Tax=Coccidioides immitis H538.4 TaxID=396776 RepID=A0A0J8UT18_COCIT|nr:chromodomain helicase hrp1 [Coccidioides immitis H538.4]
MDPTAMVIPSTATSSPAPIEASIANQSTLGSLEKATIPANQGNGVESVPNTATNLKRDADSEHPQATTPTGTTDGVHIGMSSTSSEYEATKSPRGIATPMEADGDSHMEDSSEAVDAVSSSSGMSGHESKRGVKRKSPIDESDFIRNNPSLYGLRRSNRTRSIRQTIQSTTDSESEVSRPIKRRRPQPNRKRSSSQSQDSDADSSSDVYSNTQRRQKVKRRRLVQPQVDLAPAHGEVRFSTRRSNKVLNYNEDDDDDLFGDESDNMTPLDWATVLDDNRPAIDVVLNHRLKDDVDPTRLDLGRSDFEFYIKWQGKSHYHATWETDESLVDCRSNRRLDNYVRKLLIQELSFMKDPDMIPEEKEKWNLDRERDIEAIEDFKLVERVIGSRKVAGVTEYYVKWKRLFYESCTWEGAELVSSIAQQEIDRYLDRCSRPPVSSRLESNQSTRSAFEPIHGTPDFVCNGQLKDFQVKGVNFMAYNWVRGRNVVLADEMGLGKTVQTVTFINWLRHVRNQQGPFIVVVPLSTMPSWAETFDYWTPDLNYVVYSGNEASRNIIKEYELLVDGNIKRPKFHVLLTTYEYVLVDASFLSQIKWQFLAVDEAHRLKNRDSQLYAKLVEFKSPSRLLITGTPVQNNLGELSALMDFLNPGLIEIDENMDLSSEAASVKLAELTKAIQPFMLRRTKSKVESDLPPKSEKIIRVELSDVQLEYYKNILTKNYAALNQGAKGQKQSLLNIMMELKKASNHPFMFANAEDRILQGSTRREDALRALITSSGKMMLLDQLLAKLKNDGHRVLIFSQMVRMLDILADYMDARGFAYQRLDGTIAAGPRRLSIEHFNAPDSTDFAFLLSTRAGGLGINLMTADTVILFDSDWNPQADLQAMARAHRIGQTKPVSVYRLVSKDTVEEEVIERARNKLLLEFITIQRGVTDKEATELKDKMVRAGHHINEPTSSEDISRILKRRGQRMFEQSGNQKKLEEIDIDAVLANAEEHKTEQAESMEADGGEEFLKAFEFVDVKVDDLTWDEIIPKEELERIKSEERKEMEAKYLAEEIERSQPRKRKEMADEREERQAKRKARQQVNMDVDDDSDAPPAPDPKRPLTEKEIRHLTRAYLRYGDFNDRERDILREAKLLDRDPSVVNGVLKEIVQSANRHLQEANDEIRALEREGKTFTKKERKAVLFNYGGVKRLNAETIVERPNEMRILRQITSRLSDPKSFRVPEATKAADYSCTWGAREDGILCIGIARHGYGAWAQIRDDPDLGLTDKFFLEEHRADRKNELTRNGEGMKSPGAVHLVRRADYLLSVLKDKMSNGASPTAKKAVENHHRNNRKPGYSRQQNSGSVSASPAPPSIRKRRESDALRHRVHTRGARGSDRPNTPTSDTRKGISEVDKIRSRHNANFYSGRRNDYSGVVSNNENMLKMVFKPIRDHLRQISQCTKEGIPDKNRRAKELRRLLHSVGGFIHKTLDSEETRESLEARLWDYVARYWPNQATPGSALLDIYKRMVAAENAPQPKSTT